VVMAPSDQTECRRMLQTALQHDGPTAVRYPRGSGPLVSVEPTLKPLPLGRSAHCRKGREVAILAFGTLLPAAQAAAEALDATLLNMRFIKPLDAEAVRRAAQEHTLLVTVEENVVAGGAGSAVNEALEAAGISTPVLNLGLPDRFVEQGDREELLAACGLDRDGIIAAIHARQLANTSANP